MLELLAELEMPTIVVLTKKDKLSKKAATERARAIERELQLDEDQTILFSSLTGEGRDELASAIVHAVTQENVG
jgi:GTP-binding protein